MNNNRNWLVIIGCGVVACLCLAIGAVGGAGYFLTQFANQTDATAEAVSTAEPRGGSTPVGTARSTPSIEATRPPLPAGADAPSAPETIFADALPKQDLVDIAVRFKGVPAGTTVECAVRRPEYNVGDRREFTLSNSDTNTLFKITAELKVKTKDAYAWVETTPDALRIDQAKLQKAMDRFTASIAPTNRAFFGSEANPGVDCDPHVYILHASGVGKSVGGYFSSPDGFPKSVRDDSNEAELFLMHAAPNYNGADPASTSYFSTLAHEFQHMISHNNNHSTDLWLEEGAAQLAERLNGFADDPLSSATTFASQPETQLTVWEESSAGGNSKHYGAAYLWWSYILDRFGEANTKKLARETDRSTAGFMRALAATGSVNPDTGKAYTFPELFADWVAANYNGKQAGGGAPNRWNYSATNAPPFTLRARLNAANYPYTKRDVLNQFGTHYIDLRSNKALNVEFTGATQAALLPATDSDGIFWYSGRGDESDPRLSREFDLTGVTKATLKYRALWRVEEDYDYAYASVSTDGGGTWVTLKSSSCTKEDPNKSNLGCGYTGSSGGKGNDPVWKDETADLSAYAGKKIQLRFEVVSDAAVHREGLAVDNIEIPEIKFKDGVNTVNGWKAEGFVRSNNVLPQTWSVQVIFTKDDNTREVKRMTLDGNNTGTLAIPLGAGYKGAVIAVSPTTLVTTEQANYEIKIK